MQHHVHATRAAPHLRAGHHHSHMAMPPHAPHPHAAGMEQHLGALAAATVASQQQQQQQQQQAPQQQRDAHHGRLNHHLHQHHLAQQQQQQQQPPPPQQSNAAYHNNNNSHSHNNNSNNNNQMQKIRQQHQHLNTTNGHLTKPPPPPQAYNHMAPNPAGIAYSQLPPHHTHMAHMGSYAAQAPPPPPPTVLSNKQHYYLSAAKPSKYNNNNAGNHNNNSNNYAQHAPKQILQNTYRNAGKSNGQAAAVATEATAVTVAVAAAPTVVAATEHALPTTTLRIVGSCRNSNGDNIVIASEEICELPAAETPDNCDPLPLAEDCNSSTEHIDAAGNLPNEDSSAARNSKDKTPMCLVNELARYNKITHQYRLTSERGPAHCKTFTVTLKLGEEEYSADGFKIKKAQHLAASKAIEETKYKHPPPKIRRNDEGSSSRTHITPTVELNALAMKLGQRTYYVLDPTQMPPADAMLPPEYATPLLPTPAAGLPPPPPPPPYALRRNTNAAGGYVLAAPPMHPHHPHVALPAQRGIYGPQRPYPAKYQSRYALAPSLGPHMLAGPHGPYAPPLPVTPSKITLFVGKQKFVGIGRTLQQAKHDAAARALQVLKTQSNSTSAEALDDSMDEGDKKSPISQVHEIGIKRNMTVHFKVLREEGPAHMKNFITACIVGSIVTEGEGNGKKLSKKRAAEKMLSELQKLPPLTPTKQTPIKRTKLKTPGKGGAVSAAAVAAVAGIAAAAAAVTPLGKPERRKRLSVALKEKEKPVVELDDAENPITKLIQLQQTRKEKEPIFELIAKNGNESSRRREFVMEVSASGSTARGTGNSKKLAKRNAAQALLELLESTEPSNGDAEHGALDNNVANTAAAEPPAVMEVPMVSTPAGPVPGILILRQNKKPKKKDVVVVKEKTEPVKEKEARTEATATEETSSSNNNNNSSSNSSSSSSSESNANEAVNGSESTLNTSTGSNTSGVSSNSSNASGGGGGGAAGGGADGGGGGGVHMKEQLIYLSKLLDFEVNFSDYPKGNHNEFLTIVTLSTSPPQICHGVGKSCEESQNAAARNALKILSELGLNNAKK
ncbi:maternal effect protein staufen isoform X1 [Drosophila sulfurigaster albostrigata]|uniref:maternal effect protein staufen isoform X1 n=1 Tax=Drosophila sulfurigaster albostrigata TaxID=89887 RepID=UPI002D21C108|nr:maternal effect protein staufen isoform X1 [Drosophila sulfurigaster albostrigata]